MPFTQVSADIAARLQEARKAQAHIAKMELEFTRTRVADPLFPMLKGLQCVTLYGVVEFAISRVGQRYLSEVQDANPPRNALAAGILSIALRSIFQSAADTAGMKKLLKRQQSLAESRSTALLSLPLPLPGAELQSCDGSRIVDFWTLLHLPGQPFSSTGEQLMLDEIHERRCAAAHGRESVSDIGNGFSAADLQARFNAVERLCNTLLGAATSGLKLRAYL